MENIYPIFNKIQTRADKEAFIGQRGLTVWFTGLSGSGKSTVASALEQALAAKGFLCKVLDGDNIRSGINNNLGFSAEDRIENIRRIAEVAKLMNDAGLIVITAFISPYRQDRRNARNIIGREFKEVYVSTSIQECEKRDVKGLYKAARAGKIANFTGITSPYEIPEYPEATVDTTNMDVEACVDQILCQLNLNL